DPVFAIGRLRALFLQALYPRAMAGVAQNSDLTAPPWGRLLRTARYVHTVTFGTSEQAQRAAARVRAIHRALWAEDPDSGQRFRLDDTQALLWVHVVEAESFLSTARRAGLRLSAAQVDAYYREQVQAAQLVDIDPDLVPASASQVADYYAGMRARLQLTEQAARAARFLLWPPMSAKAQLYGGRAGWLAVSGTAFGLLPAWARRLYRLPGLPGADVPPAVTARLLRTAAVTLPTPLRRGSPILQQARARVAAVRDG
ncbi:oxygenase MpaB family protein, partial [Actinocrinis sp.]|uniref:oxygenase MpaB family protein n=1 Tax=Actinocrinis sp. TaxID=1920516 RepID=UPI002BAEF760